MQYNITLTGIFSAVVIDCCAVSWISAFVYSKIVELELSISLPFSRRIYPAAIIFNQLDQGVSGMLHFNSTLYHRLRPSMPSIIQHQEQTSYHIFNPNLLSCMPANCILELGMIPLSI
jgi:hypothetical protein